jgi:hypothetical protein
MDAPLRSMFIAYQVAALWSSTDNDKPLDRDYDLSDISERTTAEMLRICTEFMETAGFLIAQDDPTLSGDGTDPWSHAGHDLWLTQNGHGAGFWDGDWPTNGDRLTELAKKFREMDLYVGDDGEIHHP